MPLGSEPGRSMWLVAGFAAACLVVAVAFNGPWPWGAGRPGQPPSTTPVSDSATKSESVTSADTALPLVSARIGDPKVVKAQQSQSFRLDLPAVNASTRLVLRLVVSAFEPAPKSTTAFVVTIGRPGNDKSARVGYLSIFPATAFSGTRRVFPFDLTRPLSELGHPRGPVDVTIAAQVSQTGAADPAGDTITVSAVEIETAKGTGAP